jgi:hypothetical protein
MSLADIENELEKLTPEELQRLALKSWAAFVRKERGTARECSEDDPDLLAAIDDAVAQADARPQNGCSADEVRARIGQWISE